MHSPLFEHIKDYLTDQARKEKDLFIFVPFIKTSILEKLLKGVNQQITIVTTWNTNDLLSGASELSLYPYCRAKGIALYINNKIHLKAFSSGLDDMIIATANISQRGLFPDGNFECAIYKSRLANEDRLYFSRILRESRHIDDKIYTKLFDWHKMQVRAIVDEDQFDNISAPEKANTDFLISALPMTRDVMTLEKGYKRMSRGLSPSSDEETRNSIFHDLANYNIPTGLADTQFRKRLQSSFFSHPFIIKIDEFISPDAYFGEIKEWIQSNCTDVPVPSRRELTGNVQVLLEWFEDLGEGKYSVDIPGRFSQRIRRTTSGINNRR